MFNEFPQRHQVALGQGFYHCPAIACPAIRTTQLQATAGHVGIDVQFVTTGVVSSLRGTGGLLGDDEKPTF